MLSYHNDPKIKEKYLNRVLAHQKADEIVKGKYWQNGKGCAVGCTIHGDDHAAYETELGIPMLLGRLKEGIFEALPNERAKKWPFEFLEAIPVGKDMSTVWPKFATWLLTDKEWGVLQFAKTDKQIKVIQGVSDAYEEVLDNPTNEIDWHKLKDNAATNAYAAATNTAAAYAAATYAAAAAYTADTHVAATYAADTTSAAARAAHAITADTHAAAHATAYAAVREKWRVAQADKLLELFRELKQTQGDE